MTINRLKFKTRARLINQLGDQLIKNESIALLELIKNSYDADATKCDIRMKSPDDLKNGTIIIEDNGEGMDDITLQNAWLEIGTSYKEDRYKKEGDRSSKFGRLRLGEKGIGRFGVHKLGKEITLITKRENSEEYILTIDWGFIKRKKYIEDLPIKITKGDGKTFSDGHGTKIIITGLRNVWTKKTARECARTITTLNSPFDDLSSFRVSFEILQKDWLNGLLSFSDIEQYKLFEFDIIMSGNNITSFKYKFIPWPSMKKLKKRILSLRDAELKSLSRMQYKESNQYSDIDLSRYKIGEVRFRGVIFDREPRILSLGIDDKKGFKEYLDDNGGIWVFRDNMRVLDYGEKGNDWLDLDGRRVNMPTKRISNNIIIGAVYLSRKSSKDLIEKANREGFVENNAYWEFWRSIRFAIDRIESLRKTDKDLIRKHYGPQEINEPVLSSISELKEVVEKQISAGNTKNKINNYIERIQREYESITNSLIHSAGAGLNLIIIIHQIEKIIKEIQSLIRKRASLKYIEDRVLSLSTLIEGYSILVKNSDIKERDLRTIIDQCIFNMQFRLEAHKIQIVNKFRQQKRITNGICSEDHVLNALMNLIDNSIWWLGYSKTKSPKIYIDISYALPNFISIIVADNGPGFTKSTEEIIKPFVSDKPGGMGIGLHLTNQIMIALKGELIFPDIEIFDIPKEYHKGAIIALAFRKKRE